MNNNTNIFERYLTSRLIFSFWLMVLSTFFVASIFVQELIGQGISDKSIFQEKEIFPLQSQHIHAPTIVELPNGQLLAAWYQGSGERSADNVVIMGARLIPGDKNWSVPFLMADVPGFPDINPVLFIDGQDRLWLVWYTVMAHQWETSLLKYCISDDYMKPEGPPVWIWQDVLHVKPGDPAEQGIQPGDRFVASVKRQINDYTAYLSAQDFFTQEYAKRWQDYAEKIIAFAQGANMVRDGREYDAAGGYTRKTLGYPYFRRMGWQTRNKPVIIDEQRLVVPLYSDGFSFSLMAITDDWGKTWVFSEPLVGAGNIQPSIAKKSDGTLVAYMRDNGPPPKRLHISTSHDKGMSWSPVRDSDLPNPGAAADVITLQNGHWLILYNDTERGRHSLAVSISTNEAKTWNWTRRLELDAREKVARSSHYPAVIQGRDGTLHVVYSYHHKDRKGRPNKTIKYVQFNEVWVKEGDQ